MSTLTARTTVEALPNGLTLYLIPTTVADIATCLIAFPGGTRATYDTQSLALLHAELLPGSTLKRSRESLRARFDALGCRVRVASDTKHLTVSLSCRTQALAPALTLLGEALRVPTFPGTEVREERARLLSALEQSREDTRTRAHTALMHALYRKGHPQWSPDSEGLMRELGMMSAAKVRRFHKNTMHTHDACAVVAGDIDPKAVTRMFRSAFGTCTEGVHIPDASDTARVVARPSGDLTLHLKDKINIDTYLAVPLPTLTRTHADYEALSAGVGVLGGSSSGRLFHILRNQMSLTYHASARLEGFGDGYPGHLAAYTILPHDVFTRGREALRTVVREFIEKGITAKELTSRKEEVTGRHVVGLSTTSGMASAAFGALQSGLPLSYVDEYPERIGALSASEVNKAIHTHLDYAKSVTAAAGSISE